MAIKNKLQLKYVVDITEDISLNQNYDIITLSLDRETYSQDEMAYLINRSIDKIFIKKNNSYITLSKDEIHKIDITNEKFIIKIPVNYHKSSKLSKNKLLKVANKKQKLINNDISEKSILNGDDFESLDNSYLVQTSQCVSSTSCSFGYGLELI